MKKIALLSVVLLFASNLFAINTPTQSSPYNNSTGINPQVSLFLNHVSGATDYDYQLDTTATFDSPDLQTFSHSSSYSGWTVSDLRYEKKYFWRIRARNSTDTSGWSSVWNFTTKNYGVTLQSPYNNVTNINLQVSLFINRITGSENYDYQLDTLPTFDSPDLQTFTHSNSYSGWTVSDLRYGQKYYWRVRGRNDTDTSVWTSAWNFTTKNYGVTLSNPTNGATGISTTNSLYINKVTGSENYDYQLDTVPAFNSPDLQTFTHSDSYSGWTVSNLRYGQKYYWRVRGRNDTDTSAWTSAWNFTTLNNVTPDSPANNSTGKNTSTAIICDRESGNTSADNYEFEMDTTANFNSPLHTIEHGNTYSSYWIYKYNSNLHYGTKYYWRVRVRNAADTSQWSEIWNFTTLNSITLNYPTDNLTGVSITHWIACDEETTNTDPSNYEFEMDTVSTFNSPLFEHTTGNYHSSSWIYKTNSGLRYGQKYYWRARVKNANDVSDWSSVWNFTTDYEMTTPPELVAPANNSTDIPYTSFSIDWNEITGANQYQYQISTTNDFSTTVINGKTSLTDRTISNLQPNTTYFWRVRGENSNGYSPWSEIWSFTTETVALTAPVLISPSNNATETDYASVNFNWQDVFGANEYNFQISQDNSFSTGVTSVSTSNTTYNLINLNNSTTYYWRVSATDGSTTSDWSTVWSFTTKDAPAVLDAPVLVSPDNFASDISTNPTLEWNAVSGAVSYEYQYSTTNTFDTFVSNNTANTSASITNLNNNLTYYWRVQASDGTNTSDWSDVWSFTTESDISNIDNIPENTVKIYPNPASDFIIINQKNNFDVFIYDINGKLILQQNNSKNRINISNLESGFYVVSVKNKNGDIKRSIFIKNKN